MKKKATKEMEQILKQNRKKVHDWLKKDDAHKIPVSRRDFMVAGVQSAIGTLAAPSIFTLLDKMSRANAADCPSNAGSGLVPWVQVNLQGGMGMAGCWAPFDVNGNKLNSYTTLRHGQNPDIDTTVFGNGARFYTNENPFVQGLQATAGALLQNCAFVGVPCRSNDDTDNNRMDPIGIVEAAGQTGVALPNLEVQFENRVRRRQRYDRHRAAFNMNKAAPLLVNRFSDLAGALGFAGALGNLNTAQVTRFAQLVQNLNTDQARSLASLSGGANIANLMECATEQNYNNIANQSVDSVDPRNNNAVQGIYDLNDQEDLARASMVYNSITGIAGPASLEFSDYDYHGNSKQEEDDMDLQAGEEIGRIIQMAAALNSKIFIPILSDGAVSCNGSDEGDQWNSDSGNRGVLAFIAYDPAGVPATNGSSIGGFTNGQVADDDFTTGNSAERAAAAIALNWAKFSGNQDLVLNVLPPNTFSVAQIDEVMRIA